MKTPAGNVLFAALRSPEGILLDPIHRQCDTLAHANAHRAQSPLQLSLL